MSKKLISKFFIIAIATGLALPIVTSCRKAEEDSELKVSTDTIVFRDSQYASLYLSTESFWKCFYSFESIPNWITVTPSSGQLTSGVSELIKVTPDFNKLEAGTTTDKMVVKSNIGRRTITLIAHKGYPSEFSLPEKLVFPAGIDVTTMTLKNTGHVEINYSFYSSSYYIHASPNYGYLQPNEEVSIEVRIEREHLGDSESLRCTINDEYYRIPIELQDFIFSVNEELFFGTDTESATLNISNIGDMNLHYSVEATTNYVTLSSNSTGDLSHNQQADINVSIDKEAILSNHLNPSLNVTLNDTLVNVPIVIERKLMLSKDIIDAEYSKATDLLVYVSDDMTLNIYHPSTGVTDVVNLTYVPVSVSLSMDGTKAAVGHDAHISYVDLQSKQVINTHDITCKAGDVVLASNGWAYAFPVSEYEIHCVDLIDPNSIETTSTGHSIYQGTKAKLHPSGKYIYGADNGISPMDIEKYDIQNGTANRLYDSPYHGNYAMGGDLWLTEDGNRIITRGGTVYKTSEIQESDMLYNGKINIPDYNNPYCPWIDHLEINKEFYIIIRPKYNEPKAPFIYVVNSDNLIFKRTISLEKYQVTDYQGLVIFYEAEPYFVFANSNGKELYVLTKAIGSGLVHEWAIQTFDIGE